MGESESETLRISLLESHAGSRCQLSSRSRLSEQPSTQRVNLYWKPSKTIVKEEAKQECLSLYCTFF